MPARLRTVRDRIAAAAERADRDPSEVTLVAVSKLQPLAAVQAAVDAGQLDLGESRVQELDSRLHEVDGRVRWHFVGRLQSNKAADVVEGRVVLVHSLDRLSLVRELGRRALHAQRVQRVLVQVNVGDDPAKAGVAPVDAAALVAEAHATEGLSVEGLSTIPPRDADPRPVFAGLRALRDRLRARYPDLQHLSMGMSSDFEAAVEEGATIVRVGEAVFGARPPRRADRRK